MVGLARPALDARHGSAPHAGRGYHRRLGRRGRSTPGGGVAGRGPARRVVDALGVVDPPDDRQEPAPAFRLLLTVLSDCLRLWGGGSDARGDLGRGRGRGRLLPATTR